MTVRSPIGGTINEGSWMPGRCRGFDAGRTGIGLLIEDRASKTEATGKSRIKCGDFGGVVEGSVLDTWSEKEDAADTMHVNRIKNIVHFAWF